MATLNVPSVYSSITEALAVANPFDVILVDPSGSPYNENVVIDTANITIRANDDGVILSGPKSGTGFQINADYVLIKGFEIENFDIGIEINGGYNNITLNTITACIQYAIKISGDNNNINSNAFSLDASPLSEKHVVHIDVGNLNQISRNIITVPGISQEEPCYGFYVFGFLNTIIRNDINLPDPLDFNSYAYLIKIPGSNTINRNVEF